MQDATSLGNTTFALQRHAIDWASAMAGHALTATEKDLHGYLIVPTLVSDNKV